MRWLKWLFCGDTGTYYPDKWKSINEPPEKGYRVLVKSKDGQVSIGHLDKEVADIWVAFTLDIDGKTYKFNIKEPDLWKPIPY